MTNPVRNRPLFRTLGQVVIHLCDFEWNRYDGVERAYRLRNEVTKESNRMVVGTAPTLSGMSHFCNTTHSFIININVLRSGIYPTE